MSRKIEPLELKKDQTLISALKDRNKEFSEQQGPSFFEGLKNTQQPKVLWIGCSDSRVPESTILGLPPGEVFVHRNIANMVPNTDLSSLSAIQYAVEYLEVKHIIVCGHTNCGGVATALTNKRLGLVDHWLQNLRDVRQRHEEELSKLAGDEQVNRLVELNVLAQVANLRRHANIQDAVKKGLEIHALVYNVATGLLEDNLNPPPVDVAAGVYALNIGGGH